VPEGVVKEYTRKEFLARIIEVEMISLYAAESRVAELENAAEADAAISYCELTNIFDYGDGHTVEAGVLYIVNTSGTDKTIGGIAAKWTAAATDGDYKWTESYHHIDWSPTHILQMVRGKVDVTLNVRSFIGLWHRWHLKKAGFPKGVFLGGTWYSAKVESWSTITHP